MRTRVLIFIDWFAPGYKAGGPITSNVNIVEHLSDMIDFWVITSSCDYHATAPYKEVKADEWVEWHGAKVKYISPQKLSWTTLKQAVIEAHCDVWYINGIYSRYYSIYPLSLAKLYRPKKVIVSARGMLSPHSFLIKPLSKKIYLTVAKVLGLFKGVTIHTTNEEESCYAQQVISKKSNIVVIENLPRKMPLQTHGCIKNKGEIRLVSFARISSEKNTLFAIRALAQCEARVTYHIYGQVNSEAYWKKCQEAINELPKNVVVEYKGSVAPQDIPIIYTDYHVMYMPSTGENYGHAILESFMNGCPVVISDRTPWSSLENKDIGWDLPLHQELYAPVIDRLARMDSVGFEQMRKDVNAFIKVYLSDNETKDKYLKMFSF